jgi:hypothetical protein
MRGARKIVVRFSFWRPFDEGYHGSCALPFHLAILSIRFISFRQLGAVFTNALIEVVKFLSELVFPNLAAGERGGVCGTLRVGAMRFRRRVSVMFFFRDLRGISSTSLSHSPGENEDFVMDRITDDIPQQTNPSLLRKGNISLFKSAQNLQKYQITQR